MKRLLALVAAAAMIVGALYVRDGVGGRGGGVLAESEALRLICVTELQAVCEALRADDDDVEISVQEAGLTAAELVQEQPSADGWLTLQPWPEIVEEARRREGLPPLMSDVSAIGRSPLVLVVQEDRYAVLEATCSGGFSWRCVGGQAGRPWSEIGGEATWGPVRPGVADPERNATGLLVLGHAASGFFGRADFSTRDFDSPFATWLGDLKRAVPSAVSSTATPLKQMLQRRGAYDLVGTTEAEAGHELARAAPDRREGLTVVYLEPVAVAEVVLAPLAPEAHDRLAELMEEGGGEALAQNGWRVEGQPTASGVDPDLQLPANTNIPNGGVLEALRRRWGEITR
ncbi:MAG: hypothetical protein GEU74_07100 [Nitriliruptorales bacterium]|nr:hypothetical protein [Nitriliruptorales bacterium]